MYGKILGTRRIILSGDQEMVRISILITLWSMLEVEVSMWTNSFSTMKIREVIE
jgi:hypothetical protein